MRKLVLLLTVFGVALLALPGVAAAVPETSIDSGPPALTTSTTATFTFHSSGRRHTFRCSLDGAVFAACTTPKTYTGLAVGQHTFRVSGVNRKAVADPTPASYTWTIQADAPPPPPPPPPPGGAVVLAAGDIQNPVATCAATTQLLRDTPHDAVIAIGDLQYEAGSAANFASFFRPCWGAAAPYAKLFPAPGNHESTKGGYCGEMSGRTAVDVCPISPDSARQRYEWRVGDWTFYSLDSGTSDSTGDLTAADKAWLDQRLAASATRCQGIYWHHPRFAAGDHGPSTALADDWADVLMPRRVDLVLNGHNHNYQRFARMGPNGPDPNGIRQIIAGTGGRDLRTVGTAPAGREAASSASFGLLRLDLRADGYDWRFLPATGTFTDSGSETCR
jgi:acid phosphatase type 7